MEAFCRRASEPGDIWFATNIEIYDYLTAQRNLKFSADRSRVYNGAAIPVWISVEGNPVQIPAGETVTLTF
jgi:hypothetical protein